MRLLIIHLSDLHLRIDDAKLTKFAELVADASAASADVVNEIIIIISGDIAFSGKAREYELAHNFFKEISVRLNTRLLSVPVTTIVVPGNHDCDFDVNNDEREYLLKAVRDGDGKPKLVKTLLKSQASFREFAQKHSANHWADDQIFSRCCTASTVLVVCVNTAWASDIHEQAGSLRIPGEHIPASLDDASFLRIAVLHHPLGWLQPDDARKMRQWLETHFDFVFTGHEHQADVRKQGSISGNTQVIVLEGGALFPEETSSYSHYIVERRPDATVLRQFKNVFDPKIGYYKTTESPIPTRLKGTSRGRIQFSESFAERVLEEIGMPLRHPKLTGTLKIQDVFVWPELAYYGEADHRPVLGAEELTKKSGLVIVHGDEHSGRTSLARRLTRLAWDEGKTPIIVQGGKENESWEKFLTPHIENQYGAEFLGPVRQQHPDNVVLLVDDGEFLLRSENLLASWKNVARLLIVFVETDKLQAESIANGPKWAQATVLQILPFGQLLTDRLIRKWIQLNPPEDAHLKLRQYNERVRSVLSNDLVPSYPFFLLAILSYLDSSVDSSQSASAGSTGNLYHSLVTVALQRIGKGADEIEMFFHYLSGLALFIREKCDDGVITRSKFEAWHGQHCTSYDLEISFDEQRKNLVACDILDYDTSEEVRFKYPFVYYYFVARALKENNRIDFELDSLIKRLHEPEAGNVVLFLCHLDKSPTIIDKLVGRANQIFGKYTHYDLTENPFTEGPMELATHDGRLADDEREKELRNRDEIERSVSSIDVDAIDPNDQWFIDLLAGIRITEILGLIAKNFWGVLTSARKVEIAETVINLNLRIIGFARETMPQEDEEWAHVSAEIHKTTGRSISPQALKYNLFEMLILGTTIQVARALGHQNLLITLERLDKLWREGDQSRGRKNDSDSIAASLIHASAKLEFGLQQYDVVFDLLPRVNHVALLRNVLRRMVWRHLHLYNTDYKKRQRLCSKLDIRLPEKSVLGSRIRKNIPSKT